MIRSAINQTESSELEKFALSKEGKGLFEINKRKKETIVSSSDDDDDELENAKSGEENEHDSSDVDLDEYKSKKEQIEEEEKDLETLVFGSESSILINIDKLNKKKKEKKRVKKPKESESIAETLVQAELGRKPAWQDTADHELVKLDEFTQFSNVLNTNSKEVSTSEIEESLKARFAKYYGKPIWADLESKDKKKKSRNIDDLEDDEDEADETNDNLFQQTGNFLNVSNKTALLPKGVIDIKICTDANKEEPHQGRLKSVEFHPSARVMLTAGLGQKLTLFQIDGKKNAKIQTIFIDKFPILAAHFTHQSGDEIIMGSRHKNFYYYDMIAGKVVNVVPPVKAIDEYQRPSISANFQISPDNKLIAFVGSQGQVHLFSAKSKEWIDTLKINGACNSIAFSFDSRYLFAFGDDKDVNIFDMNDRGHRCLHKFTDFGCLSGTSVAVSNNSQFIATGCKSGVVNLYNLNDCMVKTSPNPLKSFMNLTTPCTSLKFNSTNEILAVCSSYTENACKLIHLGSMSVFSNFPLQTNLNNSNSLLTAMRIPQCIDFSTNSGYFTIGNHKGNALLYRLKYYGSY